MRRRFVLFAFAIIPTLFFRCDRHKKLEFPISIDSQYFEYFIPYKENDTIKYRDSIGNELELHGNKYRSYYESVSFSDGECGGMFSTCSYIQDLERIEYELKDINNDIFFQFFMEVLPPDNGGGPEVRGRLTYIGLIIISDFPDWTGFNSREKELVLDGDTIVCLYNRNYDQELYFKHEDGILGFKDKHGTLWKIIK